VADLDALRGNLDLDRIDLLGHSWGGLLALLYALEHGDRIRKMVLVAPAVTYYPNPSWSEFLATLPDDVLKQIESIRADKRRSPIAKQAAIWRITLREFFYQKSVLEEIDLERMSFTPEVGNRLAAELDGIDLRPRLSEFRIPTLIIAGRRDLRLPVKYHGDLSESLPDARLVVFEDSGHFPFLEEREQFADIVSRFL
jgi:proline iminopeptidase